MLEFFRRGLLLKLDRLLEENPGLDAPAVYKTEVLALKQAEVDGIVQALVIDDTPPLPDPDPPDPPP